MLQPLVNSDTALTGKTHFAEPSPRLANRIEQLWLLFVLTLVSSFPPEIRAQGGGSHTLYGDLKVDERKVEGPKPIAFDILLYTDGGYLISRQSVPNNGRYRFLNLRNAYYDVVVEVENAEVARLRVFVSSPYKNDFRQDISMEWRPGPTRELKKAGLVSVVEFYKRSEANQVLFEKADKAIKKKDYQRAVSLLQHIVNDDPKDYQAWTELGTVYLGQTDTAAAEKAYLRALTEQPSFTLALINLGRLRIAQKNFEGAIESLSQAVKIQPQSADANYFLGEAYLQIKKGSKAVDYLNAAGGLGRTEAHLRLAALYNAAGLKERAAVEYEEFLKKRPNHPDRNKLEEYIVANKRGQQQGGKRSP